MKEQIFYKISASAGSGEDALTRSKKKPLRVIAIMAALFFAAALAHPVTDVSALNQLAATDDRSDSVDIRISDGKLSGTFTNRPLFDVLEAIRSQVSFEYRGDKDDLNRPVSGSFKETALAGVMKRVLEPFNYIIVFKADGAIERLHIVGFRGSPAESIPAEARVPPQARGPTSAIHDEPEPSTYLDLAIEEYLSDLAAEQGFLSEMANVEREPPPELLDALERWQQPWSEETGLPIPPPWSDETGLPIPPPWSEETGPPIPPGMDVEDLPEDPFWWLT